MVSMALEVIRGLAGILPSANSGMQAALATFRLEAGSACRLDQKLGSLSTGIAELAFQDLPP